MTVQGAVAPGWIGLAGFRVIWISCIFVEASAFGFGFAIVTGKFLAGDRHHFSIKRLICAGFTEIMITVFTSPPELMSHHRASTLSRASPSKSPDSKTSVGQPAHGGSRVYICVCLFGGVSAKISSTSNRWQSALKGDAHLSHLIIKLLGQGQMCCLLIHWQYLLYNQIASVHVVFHPCMFPDLCPLLVHLSKLSACGLEKDEILIIRTTCL